MPASHVLAPHDDGTWQLARLLDQYRGPDGWRCVVTYSTAPGMRCLRAYPAEQLRPSPNEPENKGCQPSAGEKDAYEKQRQEDHARTLSAAQ
jgi:hypothetical protein